MGQPSDGSRLKTRWQTAGWCWALAAGLSLSACHGLAPPLSATQETAELPAQARVVLLKVDGDILRFRVFNLTAQSLIISRDAISMSSSQGVRGRKPGGVANAYLVPGNGFHDVNVRFDFDGVKTGETLNVLFDRALLIADRPLPMPPISLRVLAPVTNDRSTRF